MTSCDRERYSETPKTCTETKEGFRAAFHCRVFSTYVYARKSLNLYINSIQVINNLTSTHQIIHKVICYLFIPLVISLVKVKRI